MNRKASLIVIFGFTLLEFISTPLYAPNDPVLSSIASETVVTSPTDRARRKVGVGEDVTLTFVPAQPVSWSISGGGTLTAPSGQTLSSAASVTFTAPDTAGASVITATSITSSAFCIFNTVAPSGILYEYQSTTGVGGVPLNLEVQLWQYITPNDVNFLKIQTREDLCYAACTGYFAPHNVTVHPEGGGLGWPHMCRTREQE